VRIVFFGTSEFGVPALNALREAGIEITAVVTTQERPKGRGLTMQPSPVKTAAQRFGTPVLEPEDPNDAVFIDRLRELRPEAIVLAAYRFILKPELLAVPPRGCLNIHPSLLPAWRGAAPVQRALMAGEKETGVSIFLMNDKIDQGDVVLQDELDIGPNETFGELLPRLAALGAQLVVSGLDALARGNYQRITQDRGEGSYAEKIRKEERVIDWHLPAAQIHNLIRALSPSPAAYTLLRGKRLEILASELHSDRHGEPGEAAFEDRRLIVAAELASVELVRVKPEGGKPMSGADLLNGKRIAAGEKLGEP
jgi:methionyl-tRNA formyltransferase